MAYERIGKPWRQYYNQFMNEVDTSDPEKSCKLKSIRRCMMWTRGEIEPKLIPWEEMVI